MSKLAPWLTEDRLAKRVVDWALQDVSPDARKTLRVLEPSAGEGAMIRGMLAAGIQPENITAIELSAQRVRILRAAFPGVRVVHRDFVSWCEDKYSDGGPSRPMFDVSVLNPPYDDGQDLEHVEWASVVAERVTCLVRSVFKHGLDRARLFGACQVHREVVISSRPHFIDREAEKDGSPRHDFSVFDLERKLGREQGWSRETHPSDMVRMEWW